eukprot:CAMPEP_0176309110 /NCGR_PEP_ID=MMETSP0121_2-20121125/64903_1 /TAXON_ID=160619 /ORGANISM="Kryptoperidinium foliaceum, Strain CCMP 1326" /LENGTH=40 /DNA_ID= /DNA_START= /DNA_END= /DNA_ORIENTATION=
MRGTATARQACGGAFSCASPATTHNRSGSSGAQDARSASP